MGKPGPRPRAGPSVARAVESRCGVPWFRISARMPEPRVRIPPLPWGPVGDLGPVTASPPGRPRRMGARASSGGREDKQEPLQAYLAGLL